MMGHGFYRYTASAAPYSSGKVLEIDPGSNMTSPYPALSQYINKF